MKKTMVAAAVVAVGAMAAVPGMASAEQWTLDGNPVVGTTSVTAEGSVTIMPVGSALRITCAASLAVTLGEDAAVRVEGADFSDCVTNLPGCPLTLTATGVSPYVSTLPWLGEGYVSSGEQRVAIDDVSWVRQFSAGCPAPLTGAYFPDSGDLVPFFDAGNQQLQFTGTSATGTLTSALGTSHIDGQLDLFADGTIDLS